MNRRADGAVGTLHFLVRIVLALAVALLSIPLLSFSAFAEGEGDTTPTEEVVTTPAPAEETPATEPEAPVEEVVEPEAPETSTPPPTETEEPAGSDEPAKGDDKGAPVKEDTSSAKTATEAAAAGPADLACTPFKVDRHDQNTQEDRQGEWQNGNLNENNSAYAEGDYVPHRLVFSDLTPGTHTVTVSYDRIVSDSFAYDFLDHLTIEGSDGAEVSWDAEAGNPPMPAVDHVVVVITFTINDPNDSTANIIFDGHIAAGLDYYPDAEGAGSVPGSPYHVSVDSISCGNVGQMDRSLKASAVGFSFVTLIKNAVPNSGDDFTFDVNAPNDIQQTILLDDDADATLSNTAHFSIPPGSAGPTSIEELLSADSDWSLTDITCDRPTTETATKVTFSLADRDTITCTFTNTREANLEVDKYWVINGGAPVQEGSEPAHLGLGAQLKVNGGNQPWNSPIAGFLDGSAITLNETVTFGNSLCTWADPAIPGRVTEDHGDVVNGALPYADTLEGGMNHYTITNTVTCNGQLTLVKDVLNGPALESAWTLSATPLEGGIAFASGASGVSHPVSGDSLYQLDENDADTRYEQVGAWTCTANGTVTTLGGEQRVEVAAGLATTCTVVNATSELVLVKDVQNPNGGTANADDFTLVASPQSGGSDLSGPGSETGTSYFVNPGETFDLSETGGPEGYTLTGINCGSGPVTSIQVPVNTTVTCTFTNVDSPGSLTLDKIVDDNGTGDSTPETAWHLSGTPQGIADQPTIEGDGGATGATKAGTYVLDEVGPATHTEGEWSCTDDEGDVPVNGDNEIVLAASQNVVCEITNTAITPQLTLIKNVDPGDTGDETGPEAFTLFAIPDEIVGQDTVSGQGPEVNDEVMVGTYTLDEDGPSTYEMDDAGWTCTDAQDNPVPVSADDQFTIGLAQHITCEVTNNAIPSGWVVTKTSSPVSGSTVEPGDVISYTVTVTRTGDGVNVEDIDVTDTLSNVPDAWVSNIVASNGTTSGPTGGVIEWHIDEVSDTVTLTYDVTVGADAWDQVLHNVVTPGTEPCVDPVADDPNILDCDETTHFTPHYTLDKSVDITDEDGDGEAEPGETLVYTLTVVNDSLAVVENAVIEDDVSDLQAHGDLTEDDPEIEIAGGTLTWTVPTLAAGASATASYTLTIGADEHDVDIDNLATPGPGGDCIVTEGVENECSTSTPTPPVTTMVVEKQSPEGAALAEAEFQLWKDMDNTGASPDDGECVFAEDAAPGAGDVLLGTVETGVDGQLKFPSLEQGCYFLVESTPPPGYELPEDNVQPIAINEANFIAGGDMAAIVVTDFAEGLLAIVAKRQFEFIDGAWVESDGEVGFGDVVKYIVTVSATGPKVFHDVLVADFVPGFNPDDTTSTVEGTLREGTAQCTGTLAGCLVEVDEDNLVTWDIGTLDPAIGETITGDVEMIVEFPQLPDDIDIAPGETFTAAMWNQGFLFWREVIGGTPPAVPRGSGFAAGVLGASASSMDFLFKEEMRASNEVVVIAEITADPIIDKPLPDTGAQAYLGQLAGLGGLVLALGLVLVGRGRRKEQLEA